MAVHLHSTVLFWKSPGPETLTWHCRYLVADDKDTLYVSFMGTKQRRDLVTNAAVLQEPLWPDAMPDGDFIAKVLRSLSPGIVPLA